MPRLPCCPRSLPLMLLVAFTASGVAAPNETVVIDDPLQGKTLGEQVGGRFVAGGYQPREKKGHILYRLPTTVVEGYVEFELRGMTNDVPAATNHGFFCMYDGRGIDEPIQYSVDYKENFFRWNAHWRQSRDAFKCVLQCSAPTPERLNAKRAVFPRENGGTRDWREEPTGKTFTWDPNRWHKIRIEWRGRNFSVRVAGQELWAVTDAPYDYAPVEHRAWLGSVPGYPGKYENELPDITYRNFRLVAWRTLAAPKPSSTSE